jgi:hypothetical protein
METIRAIIQTDNGVLEFNSINEYNIYLSSLLPIETLDEVKEKAILTLKEDTRKVISDRISWEVERYITRNIPISEEALNFQQQKINEHNDIEGYIMLAKTINEVNELVIHKTI